MIHVVLTRVTIVFFIIVNILAINSIVSSSWAVDIKGSRAADAIQGTATDDDIKGYGGHDVINGLQGNDEIEGQQGNDLLNGSEELITLAFKLSDLSLIAYAVIDM